MKDVHATLRRIDEEIVAHQQQIARSRVEISRLQETRIVLMNMAEGDAEAAQAHREGRPPVLAGDYARPVLIVRKTGTGDEDGTASRAAKEGTNKSGNLRGMNNPRGKKFGGRTRASPKGSARGEYKRKVLELLANSDDPLTSREMAGYFGLPGGMEARKPLQNALFWMRASGVIHRDAEKRYFLPRLSPPNGGAPAS